MIRTMIAVAALLSFSAGADAAACRDAKGKFIKCAPPAAAGTPVSPAVSKDAKGKCHIASGPKKGAFTKCP